MIKKILAYIRQNYDWLFDLLLIIVLAAAIWHMVTCHSKEAAQTTAKHIEAVTATQTTEKEVKTNADTLRQTQTENDKRTNKAVSDARRSVPSDIADLVSLANEIIRGSNASQR